MRFSVTALGATGERGVEAVVKRISDYLHGPQLGAASGDDQEPVDEVGDPLPTEDAGEAPTLPAAATPAGPGGYYADAANGEAGRWLGYGAGELDLGAEVQPGDFEALLAGRDPRSGQRLISARGSAGRVPAVGVGTAARWNAEGTALYESADVAALLRWSRSEVTRAMDEGELLAQRGFVAFWCGTPTPDPVDAEIALVPWIGADGQRYVSHQELARVEGLVRDGATAGDVLAGGEPDEELSVPAAARELGTSRSYMARLCRTYEQHGDEITALLSTGERPKRAYVVSHRDDKRNRRITRAELAAFARRRRRPAVRVGYDVPATTAKSVSVVGLLGGPQVRREVLAALQDANDTGMAWLQRHAAAAREGDEVVGVTGWTVASFRHLTSRRLDPFAHYHNVVPNTVVDDAGTRRALDARRLYRSVGAVSAVATAEERYQLTSRLGLAYRRARHGGWEIAGIGDGAIDEFSTRMREVKETMRELENLLGRGTTLAERQGVVAATRPAKQTVADEAELLAQWWQRARAVGLSPQRLQACLGRATPTALTPELRAKVLAAIEEAVTAERSVFTRTDVLTTLVDLPVPDGDGPLIVPAPALERLADDFLASARVVPLMATSGRDDVLHRRDGITIAVGGQGEAEYTTAAMLAIQARVCKRYAAHQGSGAGMVDPTTRPTVMAQFSELSTEQRRLVEAFCTSGDRFQSAVGRPGTGKTHAMRAAAAAWERSGYRVLGAAITAEAARHLGAECGIEAEPLAWYLGRLDDPQTSPLDARTVLVVDEASTIGDRDLDRLLAGAEATGAVLRFLGDPQQHGSLPAGGMWRVLTAQHPERTPQLTVGQRMQHEADQAAADALRDRRVDDALAALEAAGHLHIVPQERDLYVALLDRWWHARQNGDTHPMACRRNDQRLVLNRLARVLRRQTGELGAVELQAAGDRRFAAGDEVVARVVDRWLHTPRSPGDYVRNGSHGRVVAVHRAPHPSDDHITVNFSGIGVLDLPRDYFDERKRWGRVSVGLDHAYAETSYSQEGLTHARSSSQIDRHSTRPELYVNITRGRKDNHVFITRAEDPLDGERLPALPPPPERRRVEARLKRSGPEITALELDRLAGAAALQAWHKSLATLTRERLAATDGTHTLVAQAERIRETQVARHGRSRPDRSLVDRLVQRPAEAFLAGRYDALLGDMAAYRERWQARPDRQEPWGWALGQTVDHPEATEQRRRLVERLEDLSVETVARRGRGSEGGPSQAARELVPTLAGEGALGSVDLDRLGDAIDRIDVGPPPSPHHISQLCDELLRDAEPTLASHALALSGDDVVHATR